MTSERKDHRELIVLFVLAVLLFLGSMLVTFGPGAPVPPQQPVAAVTPPPHR